MDGRPRTKWRAWLPRLLGLVLLALILTRLDLGRLRQALRTADVALVAVATLGTVPLILIKTVRWQELLRGQSIRMRLWPAFLAYFGSLFVGLLTPGRLGEFVKAVHVSRDCGVPSGQAFSSVLADRLFDLYALMLVGGAALVTLAAGSSGVLAFALLIAALTLPLALFLSDATFAWLQRLAARLGPAKRLLAEGSWLAGMRGGLRQLGWRWVLVAVALTVAAYILYFGQCYLLALALDLGSTPIQVTYAVALGSLVTLVPISISGLGTREAAIIAYLGRVGVPAEPALGFSLLVFVTFYVVSGLLGAVAWWVKPVGGDVKRQT